MFSFLLPHLGTILVGLPVLAGLAGIAVKLIRDKRRGKCPGCGHGCAGCRRAPGRGER